MPYIFNCHDLLYIPYCFMPIVIVTHCLLLIPVSHLFITFSVYNALSFFRHCLVLFVFKCTLLHSHSLVWKVHYLLWLWNQFCHCWFCHFNGWLIQMRMWRHLMFKLTFTHLMKDSLIVMTVYLTYIIAPFQRKWDLCI